VTADRKIQWCRRCHHAITLLGGTTQGWGHVSDDDWAGPQGECQCTWDLTPCSPGLPATRGRLATRTPTPMGGLTVNYVLYDEAPVCILNIATDGTLTGTFEMELTEYGKAWVAAEILKLKLADPPA
jgi:hypothetical protein